jgi:hypothetical protein
MSRIAKAEKEAADPGRAAKVLEGAGYAFGAYQAAKNFSQYCTQ